MIQRNQIGKYRSVQSLINAKLGRTFVTPNGEKYKLVSADITGRKRIYVYEWINCPSEIIKITTNRIQSKTELGLENIMCWVNDLKCITKQYK